MNKPSNTIGIDFGTHKTLVARWDESISRPVLVRLRPAHGDDMPSSVHVGRDGKFSFGDEADRLGLLDPDGYQRAFKRDLANDDAPYLLHSHEFTAADLCREYLCWIKNIVETECLHDTVEHAVFTVPASWLAGAREALRKAATDAGFASLELVDEPVAAGMAFLHSRRDLWSEGALMVFDWGAGTLDLAVLTLENGQPRAIPDLIGGKPGLGGEDIDRHLVQSVNKRLVQLKLPKLERRPPEDLENVRRAVTEWKIRHSAKPDAVWQLPPTFADFTDTVDMQWTSHEVAERIDEKIKEAIDVASRLLQRAEEKKLTPQGILLVGGSSQFASLKLMLESRFPESKIFTWDQRISAVAIGATYSACGAMASSAMFLSDRAPERLCSPIPTDLVLIPSGWFKMGRTNSDLDKNEDAPPISVNVSEFHMGKCAVTRALWDEVWNWGLSNGYTDLCEAAGKAADHPVQSVTWWDAVKWCNALSEMEGLTPVYTNEGATYKAGQSNDLACDWNANGYRLPTEAEWEKAARGGIVRRRRFPWGDTISHKEANFRNHGAELYATGSSGFHPGYNFASKAYTSPVGSFASNDFGLYDMAGNVWEWCWDRYGKSSYADGLTDPRGAASGATRVFRGGSWSSSARYCRSANRDSSNPSSMNGSIGFRLVRSSVS